MDPLILALLAGCNRYELFLVEDHTGGDPGDVDVLFVIDGSESMVEESVSLAENFGRFVTRLSAATGASDVHLAITSIDAAGSSGALLGSVMQADDPRLADTFLQTLLCDAACFPDRQSVGSDPSYACDQGGFTGVVSQEYLDCLCGDTWLDNCGGGVEEGIEAVYDAMCRAVDAPPPECFQDSALTADQQGTNQGLLRPGATLIPVVVTDEGDTSPRVPRVQAVPDTYVDLFDALGVPMVWAAIDPALTEDFEVACPSGATSWGLMRYAYLVDGSGGLRVDIHGADCGPADWSAALDLVGNLVGGGVRSFALPRLPVEDTIVVALDGRPVDVSRPEGESLFGAPLYSDGWTYEAEDNTVVLHGDVVPQPGDELRIYFLPR